MYTETQGMHDVYLNWIAELMDYIYKNSGEETLYQSMRQVMEELARPFEGALDNLDYRSRVGIVAETLRGHGCALEIEEDDEKDKGKKKGDGKEEDSPFKEGT